MTGEFIYKIGSLKFQQKELTWGNDKKLLKIYSDLSAKNPFKDEELKLADIPVLIEKYNLVERFMGLILVPKFNLSLLFNPLTLISYYFSGKVYMDKAANSMLKQIWSDFFFLNRDVVNKLMELSGALDLMTRMTQKLNPNQEQAQPAIAES